MDAVGAFCEYGFNKHQLLSLYKHILILRALWYAPPVTVQQVCEQLHLNGCGKNALRLKFAKQHGFAAVPSKPPLVVPRTIRGGGICEANDGGDALQISECPEI